MADLASPTGAGGVTSNNPIAGEAPVQTPSTGPDAVAIEMTSIPLGELVSSTRRVTIDQTPVSGERGRALSESAGGVSIASLGHSRRNSYWSDFSFHPHHVENAPAVLVWQDLSVFSKKNPEKMLLRKVSGQVTGGFWAGGWVGGWAGNGPPRGDGARGG